MQLGTVAAPCFVGSVALCMPCTEAPCMPCTVNVSGWTFAFPARGLVLLEGVLELGQIVFQHLELVFLKGSHVVPYLRHVVAI